MSNNKEKTAEELLQEALVPVEEQPYKVSENWSLVKLKNVCAYIQRGKSPKYADDIQEIPVVSQKCVQWSGFDISKARFIDPNTVNSYQPERYLQDYDILWNSTGEGTIGRVALYRTKVANYKTVVADSHVTIVRSDKRILDPRFLFYWLSSPYIQKYSISRSISGTTKQTELSTSTIKEMLCFVPPLFEQKRIADKVETLLNKINLAKQLIEEAKELFELRRAAILDKAFRGELTSNWRDENKAINFQPVIESHFETTKKNEIPKNWAITNFDSIAANEKYALAIGPFGSNLKVTDYREEGVPLIFVRNIRSSNYELANKFVSEEKAEELKAHMVEKGDILITKMGDPPGDADICPESIEKAVITADCIKVRVNTEIVNRKYLLYAIKSDFVQSQIRRESKGVAQQKISLQAFRKMNVIIAPFEEQLKIVEELEGLMEKEKRSIENLELMDENLYSLEQAILSKAFRGQLGTSDPLEENAIDILQQVK